MLAKKYNIRTLPTLAFFRNKEPLIFKGDIEDEDDVLSWLTDENTLEIPGKIEEVNVRMLENILDENDYVVVFFCEWTFSKLLLGINYIDPQIKRAIKKVKKSYKSWKILMRNVKKKMLTLSKFRTMESARSTIYRDYQLLRFIDTNSVKFTRAIWCMKKQF